MLVKVTSRLTQEKFDLLKTEGKMADNIRQAVDLYLQKHKYHIELYRSGISGYAYFDILAKNLEEALIQASTLRATMTRNENIKDNFWYLKEVKQVN
jgi:hypothetical protein